MTKENNRSLKAELLRLCSSDLRAHMEKYEAWLSLLVLAILVSQSGAQDVSCLNQLVPCLNYLNSNEHPSSDCCDPLKSIVEDNPQCICSNVNRNISPGQNAINVTEALLLPSKCGLSVDASICSTTSRNNRGPNATRKTDVSSSAVKTSSTHVLLVIMAVMTVHFIWASAASQVILG